jgi:hypothetical protein
MMVDLTNDYNFVELCTLLFYLNNAHNTYKIDKIKSYYFDAIKKYYIDLSANL